MSDSLRSILLCEFALVTDAVEELSSNSQLSNDVELVLGIISVCSCRIYTLAYPGLEPIHKLNDMRMVELLKHFQLIIHHLLVALDILLEYYLDCHLLALNIGLSNYAICASTESSSEPVHGFLVVAARLTMQLAEHIGDCGTGVSAGLCGNKRHAMVRINSQDMQ